MYDKLKPKAVEMIKKAKKQNEFVATKIQNQLKAEFDNVPSDQTLRNWARDINSEIEKSDQKWWRDEYMTVEDQEWNKIDITETKVKQVEQMCEERWIDLTKRRMYKIIIGAHTGYMKDDNEQRFKIVDLPNTKVWLERDYTTEDKEAALEAIYEQSKEKEWEVLEYKNQVENKVSIISPADLHMWKIAYQFISGDEYNMKTATNRLKEKL